MKRALILLLVIQMVPALAQEHPLHFNNRVGLGWGGENAVLGVDYSRNVYHSKLFVGAGYGLAGWLAYINFEPFTTRFIVPFAGSGICRAPSGTVSVSEGAELFSVNAGVRLIPGWNWRCLPFLSAGASYYTMIKGSAEGGLNALHLLLKLSFAFPGRE